MTMRIVLPITLGILLLAQVGEAAEPELTGVSVSPNPAMAGGTVHVTVSKAGPKCGVLLDYGAGTRHFSAPAGAVQVEFVAPYPDPGAYTITAAGKKKGSNPRCKGTVAPVTVQVDPRPGAGIQPTLNLAPLPPKGPESKAPKPGSRSNTSDAAADVPNAKAPRPTLQKAVPLKYEADPVIGSFYFTRGPVGGWGDSTLAPGGRVTVDGTWFGGDPGELYLAVPPNEFPQYPNGRIVLEDIQWEGGTRVSGRVPSGLTDPLESQDILLVLRTADGKTTFVAAKLRVPFEVRVLAYNAPEIRSTTCSTSSRMWHECMGRPEPFQEGATLFAAHSLDAIHDYGGGDHYWIKLENGWRFNQIRKVEARLTGDDGDRFDGVDEIDPPLPWRGTSWRPTVTFRLSDDDSVHYGIWVEVIRAKGL